MNEMIKHRAKTEAKFSFETVKNFNFMQEFIDKSNLNKRVPLIVATKSAMLDFKQIKLHLQEQGCTIKKFDLRKVWDKQKRGFLTDYYDHVKNDLAMFCESFANMCSTTTVMDGWLHFLITIVACCGG